MARAKRQNPLPSERERVMADRKSSLTACRQKLLGEMQRINFGRIERLAVSHGQPAFDPPPHIVREIKFGGDNDPRPEVAKTDFSLKAEVLDLFAQMEALGDGTISIIEIKHGLPFRMTVEEVCA